MGDVKIKIGGKEYTLNSNKYERAKIEAGKNSNPKKILAIYDRLLGQIKNEQKSTIKNGIFWEKYQKQINRNDGIMKWWNKTVKFSDDFMKIVPFLIFILFLLAIMFGYDKIIPKLKYFRDLI